MTAPTALWSRRRAERGGAGGSNRADTPGVRPGGLLGGGASPGGGPSRGAAGWGVVVEHAASKRR
jgi:hypothetical protein